MVRSNTPFSGRKIGIHYAKDDVQEMLSFPSSFNT